MQRTEFQSATGWGLIGSSTLEPGHRMEMDLLYIGGILIIGIAGLEDGENNSVFPHCWKVCLLMGK